MSGNGCGCDWLMSSGCDKAWLRSSGWGWDRLTISGWGRDEFWVESGGGETSMEFEGEICDDFTKSLVARDDEANDWPTREIYNS